MEKLETIVSRLESAVSRLEAYEKGAPAARAPVASATRAAASVSPDPVKSSVPAASPVPSSAPTGGAGVVQDFDAILATHLPPFQQCAASLGGDVEKVSGIVERAFKALRTLIDIASRSQKPGDAELQELVTPLSSELIAASQLTEGRRSASYNHFKAVAEALQAFTFVVYSGPACGMSPPAQLIIDCWQSGEFYANKIMMEFKAKEPQQVEWVKLLKELMMKLQQHVRVYHTTGLKWNPTGGAASAAAATPTSTPAATPSAASPPPSSAPATPPAAPAPAPTPAPAPAPGPGGPPPPPPPPTQEFLDNLQKARESARGPAAAGGSGLSGLFSEINKGEGITSGLKKVTADMKTKNRTDRTGAVPSKDPPPATKTAGSKAAAPQGEPKIELQQKRWVVEHQFNNNEIILDDTTPQQAVYIYRCTNSVVQVKGKVNSISLDNCKGTGVVFDNVISSVEAVNCASCKLQFTGKAPTVNFDKCDGMQLYVPPTSVADPLFQVVTAKCSEINVVAMPEEVGEEEEPADPLEHAVPEQFISTFKDGKLVTVIAVHSAA